MNPALIYRQPSRCICWIAFMCALAIHLGAVALAKTKSPTSKLDSALGDVEVIDNAEPEPALLEESATPPPFEQIHTDQDVFREENLAPAPGRAYRKARPASLVRGTTASLRSVKAMVTYAPRPVYPYQARRQRATGSGVAVLTVDQTSGTVTKVIMAQSCGNAILDNSTLDALRRWRFKSGSVNRVQVPITYTLMGVSY
jgi:TonB family protein